MGSRHSTAGGAIVVTVVALLLAACAPHAQVPAPTASASSAATAQATAPTASPSVDARTESEQAPIVAAYRGYWDAQVRVLKDPGAYADLTGVNWAQVQQVAVDKALANLASTAQLYAKNGIANVGAPVLAPVVSKVVPGQSAQIADCVDGTNWQPVYTSSGKSAAAPGQAPRLVVNSTALFYAGRWVVSDSVVDRQSTC